MAKSAADSCSDAAAVQATNDGATASKLSCVKKGYMKDGYIHLFVRRPVKRSPITNRENKEVFSDLYELLPADLCNIQKLDSVLSLANMDPSYRSILPFPIVRDERLELFDEFEEWHMMQQLGFRVHNPGLLSSDGDVEYYSVVYAINDAMGLFVEFGFPDDQQKRSAPV